MNYHPVKVAGKFRLIYEHWKPRVIAEVNGYQLKIVKAKDNFVWHDRSDTDDSFFVIDGELRLDVRGGLYR